MTVFGTEDARLEHAAGNEIHIIKEGSNDIRRFLAE